MYVVQIEGQVFIVIGFLNAFAHFEFIDKVHVVHLFLATIFFIKSTLFSDVCEYDPRVGVVRFLFSFFD